MEEAITVDEEGNTLYDEEENVHMELVSKFPFHLCVTHVDHGSSYYHTPEVYMGDEDEDSYGKLVKFVDDFFPTQWVKREGEDFLNNDSEPVFGARVINTKALLECNSYKECVALLYICSRVFFLLFFEPF